MIAISSSAIRAVEDIYVPSVFTNIVNVENRPQVQQSYCTVPRHRGFFREGLRAAGTMILIGRGWGNPGITPRCVGEKRGTDATIVLAVLSTAKTYGSTVLMSNHSDAFPLPSYCRYIQYFTVLFPCSGFRSRGWFEFSFEFRAESGIAVLGNV